MSCALHIPPRDLIHSCFGKSTQCIIDSLSFSKEDGGEGQVGFISESLLWARGSIAHM